MGFKRPVDMETAVRIYWSNYELGNAEIKELFGKIGAESITRHKKAARAVMLEKNIKVSGQFTVDTKCAYEAWGIDIDDCEKKLAKIVKLRKQGMIA